MGKGQVSLLIRHRHDHKVFTLGRVGIQGRDRGKKTIRPCTLGSGSKPDLEVRCMGSTGLFKKKESEDKRHGIPEGRRTFKLNNHSFEATQYIKAAPGTVLEGNRGSDHQGTDNKSHSGKDCLTQDPIDGRSGGTDCCSLTGGFLRLPVRGDCRAAVTHRRGPNAVVPS